MEHYAQVVDQIHFRMDTIKAIIKETEIYLHKQLNSGVPIEHLSDHYSLLDTEEGRLSGLNESLKILQSALRDYREREL